MWDDDIIFQRENRKWDVKKKGRGRGDRVRNRAVCWLFPKCGIYNK